MIGEEIMMINGISVKFEPEDTVLSVAKKNNIFIPTLCHHEGLKSYGACRLCLVEVIAGDKLGLTTACSLKPKKGLVVVTDSELVLKVRGILLDLLVRKYGHLNQIQELVRVCGVEKGSFEDGIKSQGAMDCVLCGRCVRVCESMGQHVLGFIGRGKSRIVKGFWDLQNSCLGCMACKNVCPTGAISFYIEGNKIKNDSWKIEIPVAKCPECGKDSFPDALIQKVKESISSAKDLTSYCDRCKRREIALRLFSTESTLNAS